MSDWRQIQARIRKAKAAADPVVQLAALYERTHDAMVAFELARHHEKVGENQEAARWYSSAAERFRRAQWKVKAQEALTRLGAPIPTVSLNSDSMPASAENLEAHQNLGDSESASDAALEEEASESPATDAAASLEVATPATASPETDAASLKKRRRRGRRGGRGRRRGPLGKPPLVAVTPESRSDSLDAAGIESSVESRGELVPPVASMSSSARPASVPPRAAPQTRNTPSRAGARERQAIPEAPLESLPPLRGRTGDPGLSSRMAHLESQVRRLLACASVPLDQADQAPAGPGVFIVSDSDQITYYYVEACQTLRIGIANLLRAERGGTIRRGGSDSLRERFAEHLEINESKVSKYLKDHCSVRWIQLDDGARVLAHFAIAVLRPALND